MGGMQQVIGLMSGTSMDGVDVALLETDGEKIGALGPFRTYPLSANDRATIMAAVKEAQHMHDRSARPEALKLAEECVTFRHIQAVNAFMHEHGLKRGAIAAIGFHGQTVVHRPNEGFTIQLGDGQGMADALGITTVYDFRAQDMAQGGQGAPFAPIFHKAAAEFIGLATPCVFLNIGGVANLTYIGRDGGLLAFDCGPGNALLDDFMLARVGEPFDRDGAHAARGKVDEGLLARFLDHDLLRKKPPKSLDRYDFPVSGIEALSTDDGAATLTAFSAQAISDALLFLPSRPEIILATGGGVWNATMLNEIGARSRVEVIAAEDTGLNSDAIEAQAFAYLAARSLKGFPLSYPGTTGVKNPARGGVIAGVRTG